MIKKKSTLFEISQSQAQRRILALDAHVRKKGKAENV